MHAIIKFVLGCREEIAGCSERAYESLSVADARKLMLFGSDQEATQFATEARRSRLHYCG